MITGIRRVFKAGFVGFWRNAFVSFSSIYVIAIALFGIGMIILINHFLTVTLQNLKSQVDINVYFVTSAEESAILNFKNSLESLPDVASVTYTSREEALARYRESNQNNTIAMQALEELNDNPLMASLAVLATDTNLYENISSYIEEQRQSESSNNQLIESVNYFDVQEAIDSLSEIISAVEKGNLIATMILLLAAVLITFSTVRLVIYNSREEIAIMRLVGASNMFIRGPFLIQGVLYGFIAAFLAILAIYPLVVWISPGIEILFKVDIYSYFISDLRQIFMTLAGIGVVLGLFSSLLAVSRYLKV